MLAESCWSPACIHHSTSLHFPLSSLCLICLLEFLSAQLFKKKKKKILPIFHFTFPERSPILCFPSYQTPFIIFSFAPKLFFFGLPPVFLYPQLLSPPFFFFPSPLARLFLLTIRLSLLSKPQIVGSELSSLVSISWLINVS